VEWLQHFEIKVEVTVNVVDSTMFGFVSECLVQGRVRLGRRRVCVVCCERGGGRGRDGGGDPGSVTSVVGWLEEARRVLVDPEMGVAEKLGALNGWAMKGPEAVKREMGRRFEDAGLPGVPAVLGQVENDLLPEAMTTRPQDVVRAISNAMPELLTDLRAGVAEEGSGLVGGPPSLDSLREAAASVIALAPGSGQAQSQLETPTYTVESEELGYEIRVYDAFRLVEIDLKMDDCDPLASKEEISNVRNASKGFRALAKYIFGSNGGTVKMSMTTPVFVTKDYSFEESADVMSFVLPSAVTEHPPVPSNPAIRFTSIISGVRVAAVRFSGLATEGEIRRQREQLLEALIRDGYDDSLRYGKIWVMQYDGPYVAPWMRRNEVCIPLSLQDESVPEGESINPDTPD